MSGNKTVSCLLLFCSLFSLSLFAQQQPLPKVKVAVLCPLYLDSAFSDYSYKLGNKNMPQYIISGLDFYNGVMLAVDSLKKEHLNAEVWIYDTKKQNTSIDAMLQTMKFLNFNLIIASFTSPAEQKSVSQFSFANNIPVVSVTYPNDAGLGGNPYFVMLNSTLKTHVNSVYKYVHQNFLANKPIFVSRTGGLEDKIRSDFKDNDTAIRNHFQYKIVTLNNDVFFTDLKPFLDSTKQNTIVCGSMNSDFAQSLVSALGQNPQYKVTVVGMPNWDGMRKIYNTSYNNINIVYSTAFNYPPDNFAVAGVTAAYKAKFFARPSDLVFKGFEAMYHYTHLVNTYQNELIGHLSDSTFTFFNHFDIEPVKLNALSPLPDYQENKNLYFIKKNKNDTVSITQLRK